VAGVWGTTVQLATVVFPVRSCIVLRDICPLEIEREGVIIIIIIIIIITGK